MKKLLIIIGVLLIIFVSMYIYKLNSKQDNITAQEVQNIENYLGKLYMWREVTGEALPKFENINQAPEDWIWEVVKKDLEEYELTYEQIQEKAKELFGKEFSKNFPKEGTEYIFFNEEENKYYIAGLGLDSEEDSFLIHQINKSKDGYQIEIIEYLVDYSEYASVENGIDDIGSKNTDKIKSNNNIGNEIEETIESEYNVYIKNLEGNVIETVKSTVSESQIIDIVKSNIDKFSKKTIDLKMEADGKIYVRDVKE